MKKKFIVAAVAASTLALGAAGSASAAGGNGKSINDGCGATYGQLVSTARQIGHISGGVSGAQSFIESGLAAAHGCSWWFSCHHRHMVRHWSTRRW